MEASERVITDHSQAHGVHSRDAAEQRFGALQQSFDPAIRPGSEGRERLLSASCWAASAWLDAHMACR